MITSIGASSALVVFWGHRRMPKNSFSLRLLKKVQMQGNTGCETRGVLSSYAADGPFSATG
jgi:hypothetical protein